MLRNINNEGRTFVLFVSEDKNKAVKTEKKKTNCSLMKGTTQKQTSRRTASKHDLEDLKGIALCINYRNVPLQCELRKEDLEWM